MKRFLSLLLAVILTVSLLPTVRAESGPAVSHNIDSHFYVNANRWADPIYSTLAAEDGGYLRVEYIGSSLFVERYDDSFHYLSGKEIPLELPIYGGVYLCNDYNFLLVGQLNPDEDDSVEVFRIIRYSKDWEKIDHASIYGANTTIPFDAGCPRFDRSGDILYIRASHEMYADENGVNHQANVMISLRVSDMTVTDQLTKTWNNSYGYVSHSFNQFVRVDGDTLLAVDHGDYYPRSVALFKYSAKAGSETFYSRTQMVNVLPIVDSTYHYNDTGVCVGGFEYSSTDYLVAGCAYDMSSSIDLMEAHRNIFVTATPKDNCTDEATEIHWLTSYSADDNVTVSPPHFLKISSDRFFLIWTENDVVKCCFLNGKGQLDSYVLTVEGSLSDCQPIFDGNRIIWYTTDFSVPQFFQIRPNSPAFNPNAVAYGKAGDDVEWAVYNNGLLELTGTGPMYDYDYAKTPWYAHRSSIQRISVGSGITSLGENAFASCTKATEVSLPDSLKQIGAGAFYLCSNLTEVSVPQGVTELGDNVFHGCTSLASVSLPEGLQTIGIKAFYECTALTQLTVPEGVTSLGKEAFYHCAALQTVSLPATLTQIGDQAFQLCHKLNAITVAPGSASFSHDDQGALYNRDKTALLRVPGAFQGTFVIPSTVTSVAKQAADYCSGLTAVQIPDSVTSLGVEAFAYCDLRQVIIPRTITVLPAGCFTTNPHLTSVTIPETVTEIHDSVFSYCESLTAATLPAGLKVLGNSVFWGCSQLQSIVIPEGITALEQAVFYDCSALETVQLPSRLTSIKYWCFQNCTSLKDLVLPDTLETIGADAFHNTPSLKSIVFPASLKTLEAFSFKNSGLTEITFKGDAPTFSLGLYPEEYAFGGVTATVYYPLESPTWTEEVRQDYSGDLTWIGIYMHDHKWSDATCTEPRICSICGTTDGEPLGHQEVTDPGYAATCTKTGLTDGSHCGRCGKTLRAQQTIPVLGHNYLPTVTKPTCTDRGYTTHTCSRCGDSYTDSYVNALGHDWDEGQVIKEPTETEDGLRLHTCRRCKATEERIIPSLSHTHSYSTKVTAPTCTEKGYTTYTCYCGYSYIGNEVPALGHREVIDPGYAATCTKTGLTEGKHCSVCNTVLVAQQVIAAKGHHYSNGVCDACGTKDPNYVEHTHSYGDWVVVKEPSSKQEGLEKRTCSCGSAETRTISRLTNPFSDVKTGDYYYEPVLWASWQGITTGINAREFGPARPCTRGQIVTFLWRAAGEPEPTSTHNPFQDVFRSDYYYKAVLWAVENGITNGMSATRFAPNSTCTRAQSVTFLYRANNKPKVNGSANPFRDVKAGAYYYDAVLWAVENGITNGMSATEFRPDLNCTRAQIVTFLYRSFVD